MTRRTKGRKKPGGMGSKRMTELGYKAVTLWLDKSEAAKIVAAAVKSKKKTATWVREVAVEAAGGLFPHQAAG